MSASLTSHLLAALPESIWAEANRRLRLVPELWDLAQDGAVREAFAALGGDPLHWRPGPLALAAYAARYPECEGNAEAWLAARVTSGRTTRWINFKSCKPILTSNSKPDLTTS